MTKKFVKYDEIFDVALRRQVERYYRDSYRRGWYVSEVILLKNGKWLVKWERKLDF